MTREEIETIAAKSRTLHATNDFRFARPSSTTTKPDRLQQKYEWRDGLGNGGVEWWDVPVVIVDEFVTSPQEGERHGPSQE